MVNRWGNDGNSGRHYFVGLQKSVQMVASVIKVKEACSLEEKLLCWQIPYGQSYSLSKSHVQMWELYHKDGWALNNWCFWALKNPLGCTEIKPVNLKENQSWKFIGRTDTEAEAQMFGHLMWRANSLEKSLILGMIFWQKKKRIIDIEMIELHYWLNGHEFEQIPGDGKGQENLACCRLRTCKGLEVTEWFDNNIHNENISFIHFFIRSFIFKWKFHGDIKITTINREIIYENNL